ARDLGTLAAPEPSADLVARTLARVRLSSSLEEAPAAPLAPIISFEPARPKRKTAAQLLETWALPGPAPRTATPVERIWLRLSIQAAAAVLIFAICTFSTLQFYPAYVEALEERDVRACQEHLRSLESAVTRYAKDHPEAVAQAVQGLALRRALIEGGYAKADDFVCPHVRGATQGSLCYFVRLPDSRPGGRIVAWDHFGNHGGGTLNVIRQGGRPELLEGARLWAWLTEERQ
ncbi:MAG: hypothetical protein ACAI25_03085, partial [Planctomycetota bacterium]